MVGLQIERKATIILEGIRERSKFIEDEAGRQSIELLEALDDADTEVCKVITYAKRL